VAHRPSSFGSPPLRRSNLCWDAASFQLFPRLVNGYLQGRRFQIGSSF
jgi:hypothetical protein